MKKAVIREGGKRTSLLNLSADDIPEHIFVLVYSTNLFFESVALQYQSQGIHAAH